MVLEDGQIELRRSEEESKGNYLVLHCNQASHVPLMTWALFGCLVSHFRGADCGLVKLRSQAGSLNAADITPMFWIFDQEMHYLVDCSLQRVLEDHAALAGRNSEASGMKTSGRLDPMHLPSSWKTLA